MKNKKIASTLTRTMAFALAIVMAASIAGLSNPRALAAGQTIADGTYQILLASNTSYCVDIYGASTDSGANAQIYKVNYESNANVFQIEHVSNGYYRIKNVGSGLVLDVSGGCKTAGTNIWQYAWNGSDAQLWKIISNGNGTYCIQSKLGLYMDMYSGVAQNYQNLQTWPHNCSSAQRFIFKSATKVDTSVANQTFYVKTSNISSILNLRSAPSTSSTVLKKLSYGTQVTAVSKYSSWVFCKTSDETYGWASASYLSTTNPGSSTSTTETAVLNKINQLLATSIYKPGTRYTGKFYKEECKGFAKSIHMALFGYNIGSTKSKPDNYQISYSSSNTICRGSTTSLTNSNLESIFSSGRAGDVIQLRRSHGGSHTMILLSHDSSGISVVECNLDGKNTISKNTYTWSQLRSANSGLSLYSAVNYYVH